MEIYLLVAILAFIQSLFGFGIQLFGTPTLLLLGYSFEATSATLLPATLTVSLLQNWRGKAVDRASAALVVKWCVVPLAVAFILAITFNMTANLTLPIAILLGLFALLRASPALTRLAELQVNRFSGPWLFVTGLVQGFSNLGVGLAAVLASARYTDKEDIRSLVAFCQTIFVSLQMVILLALSPHAFGLSQVFNVVISAAVFLTIGQYVFARISSSAFSQIMAVIVGIYALLMFARYFGVF